MDKPFTLLTDYDGQERIEAFDTEKAGYDAAMVYKKDAKAFSCTLYRTDAENEILLGGWER